MLTVRRMTSWSLLTVLVLVAVFSHSGQSRAAVFTPSELDSPLNNPFKGWAPRAEGGPYAQPHRLVYAGITWKELEPTIGNYDWEGIEAKYKFEYWKEQGVKIIFRLLLDNPTGAPHRDIPDWLYNGMISAGDSPGTAYQDNTGGMGTNNNTGFSPNYNSSYLIERHELLLNAIADRYYTDDAPIAFVQIGSLGHWGEFHTWPYIGPNGETNYTGEFPVNAVSDQYIQHYIDAFSDKSDKIQVLIRRSTQLAVTHNLGMFNDMFGDQPSFDSSWGWYTGTQNGYWDDIGQWQPAHTDFWETAISGGEFYGGASGLAASLTSGPGFTETMRQTELSKPSWLGPNSPAGYAVGNTYQANMDTLKKRMGYHFVIKEMVHQNTVAAGDSLDFSLTVENKGVQHFPFNWPVEIRVLSGNAVVAAKTTTISLKDWKTGTYTYQDSILLPAGLADGPYDVAVAIIDPSTNQPGVDFANTGRLADGSFKTSSFSIGDSPAPVPIDITIDGSAEDWQDIAVLSSSASSVATLKAASQDGVLYLLVQGNGLGSTGAFYINSDNNTATGYNAFGWNDAGADYLLENNLLYEYTGSGLDWSWSFVTSLASSEFAKNSGVVEVALPYSLIGSAPGGNIRIGYINNGSTTERVPGNGSGLPLYNLN